MKILQITPYSLRAYSGIDEYVNKLSIELAKNHYVDIYSSYSPHELNDIKHDNNNNKLNRYKYKSWAPKRLLFFSPELKKFLKNSKYDIIHAHSYVTYPFQISYLGNYDKLFLSPHFHGTSSFLKRNILKLYNPIGKKILEKANKIIAVSKFEKQLLIDQMNIDSNIIEIIPCGINYNEFNKMDYKKEDNIKRILCVGRLVKYKNVDKIIEVIPYLEDNIYLTIVGDGKNKDQLLKLISKYELNDRIKILSNLKRNDLIELYHKSDIFILLSEYEAYSISVAEALSSGIPCIVSNSTALLEWIDNKNCYGIDHPIDLIELKTLIETIIYKNIKIDINSLLGNKIMDWEEVGNKIETLYIKS